ncbi:MAG TPA: TetR/AcrR family transcriptional regulator [Candidatus Elarobacter sp.]|nr:TetR/AcrR family transcriptional regulator [Candidatus Elarobacter sp.]
MSAKESTYARATRARILAAAERRFKHYGFAKTTIVDIANDCAMSHANVYRFFRNKTELVDAIAEDWLGKSERVCRDVLRRNVSAKQRLVDFVIELHRWKRREQLRDGRVYELLAMASHEGRPFIAVHLRTLADILVEIIEDGNRAGEFTVGDPRSTAQVIQDATVKFCDPRLVAQYQSEPLEAQAENVMHMLIAGLPTST